MLQFLYLQGATNKLALFPHVLELATKKNSSIQLQSFAEKKSTNLVIYYINEGRFEWLLDEKAHVLFPGDVVFILPGQKFGNEKGILELGTISWIELNIQQAKNSELILGKWSKLSNPEGNAVRKLLSLNSNPVLTKLNQVGEIFNAISLEIHNNELGFVTRVNHLIDELIIKIARHRTKQNNPSRDFSKVFMNLEVALRKDLSHQWSVEEMAAIAGMGITLFSERVKNHTGFTPINYLINIRISEAIKLLKKNKESITDIALDIGFYSSQHFSTTFKKLTGYSPGEFRKNNSFNE
ncbi:MAG: AraC family transcriptional regulator [Bacteroidota bacterium]|nr:AraC family transcriptional regulator [Ferruginibacter sp.]